MELLYFSAPWCGPCRMFGPIMDRLSEEGLRIKKINIDEEADLVSQYSIRSVPTVIKVDGNGNKLDMFVGPKNAEFVKEFYNV